MDRIGRYDVVRELGHGGMGSVYLGRDPELRRSVALKLLHRETTDFALKHEARALAALTHPGIVTIFEIGEHDGRQFIAMEYLDGSSLRSLLQSAKPAREELVAIVAKVAHAVAAAHDAGILHRDIKPENVVVGAKGVVKVVDFGIARRLNGDGSLPGLSTAFEARVEERVDALTRTLTFHVEGDDTAATVVTAASQTIFGTPAYMAPEVLCGEPATEPSDVYSLGVLLYECLAGRRPFDSNNLAETIAHAIEGGPHPRLDDPLADLVDSMLARDSADRPSLAAIARQLEPRRAATVPTTPEPRKRSPWPWIVILVAMLGIAGVAWKLLASGTSTTAARAPIVVGVPRIALTVPSYGAGGPDGHALAEALASLLGNRGALTIRSLRQLDAVTDPSQIGVELQVKCTITEREGWLEASVQIVNTHGRVEHELVLREQGTGEMAALLFDVAEQIWSRLVPGTPFDRARDPARAIDLVAAGTKHMHESKWYTARTYAEVAAVVDPDSFDAWSLTASMRAWTQAPDALIDAAAARALEVAPEGSRKEIWRGAAHYLRHEYPEAIEVLERLESREGLSTEEQADLDYYLGEAHWHDGNFDEGYRYFERILSKTLQFKAASIHAAQYAVARRQIDRATQLVHLQAFSTNEVDFAAQRYDELIARAAFPFDLYAQLVLGLEPTVGKAPPHGDIYKIARAAGEGDIERARELFAALWKTIRAEQFTDVTRNRLEVLGEVLLTAELAPELEQVITLLGEHPSKRGEQLRGHLVILGAPILETNGPFVHARMTSRARATAQAIQAERAGDRELAATLLWKIVRQPSHPRWDYAERAALLRNLRALGFRDQVRELCNDTLRPAIFSLAYLPLRRACTPR